MPVASKIASVITFGVFALNFTFGLALPMTTEIGQAVNLVSRTNSDSTSTAPKALSPQPSKYVLQGNSDPVAVSKAMKQEQARLEWEKETEGMKGRIEEVTAALQKPGEGNARALELEQFRQEMLNRHFPNKDLVVTDKTVAKIEAIQNDPDKKARIAASLTDPERMARVNKAKAAKSKGNEGVGK